MPHANGTGDLPLWSAARPVSPADRRMPAPRSIEFAGAPDKMKVRTGFSALGVALDLQGHVYWPE